MSRVAQNSHKTPWMNVNRGYHYQNQGLSLLTFLLKIREHSALRRV